MSERIEFKVTEYKYHWTEGLTPRAIDLLKNAKVEFWGEFLLGRHNETCHLNYYILPDDHIYYDAVQVEIDWISGPFYFFALKDDKGRRVEESRWTEEEIREEIKNIKVWTRNKYPEYWEREPDCVKIVAEDPEIIDGDPTAKHLLASSKIKKLKYGPLGRR